MNSTKNNRFFNPPPHSGVSSQPPINCKTARSVSQENPVFSRPRVIEPSFLVVVVVVVVVLIRPNENWNAQLRVSEMAFLPWKLPTFRGVTPIAWFVRRRLFANDLRHLFFHVPHLLFFPAAYSLVDCTLVEKSRNIQVYPLAKKYPCFFFLIIQERLVRRGTLYI